MRLIRRIFALLIVFMIGVGLVACFGDKDNNPNPPDDGTGLPVGPPTVKNTINVKVEHSLVEYQSADDSEVSHDQLEVGKRYKLVLNYTFNNLEDILEADTTKMDIKIILGDFDTDTNKKYWEETKVETGKGLSYDYNSDGAWESSVYISKDYEIVNNSENTYFIIGTDVMPDSASINAGISVEISFPRYYVSINGNISDVSKYRVTFLLQKGTILFDKENNLTELSTKYSYELLVPKKGASIIKIVLLTGSGVKEGEETIEVPLGTDYIEINLLEIAKKLMGKSFNIDSFYNTLYKYELTVIGGRNYHDSSFDIIKPAGKSI